jgi:hypothetical protein
VGHAGLLDERLQVRLVGEAAPLSDSAAGRLLAQGSAHMTSPERAVLGIRPHIRPLLVTLQSSSPRLAAEISAKPGALTVIGLPGCLAAVNADAVETLAVPFDGLIPGCECGRCGALGLAADRCPD